jgi:hypothetical protein
MLCIVLSECMCLLVPLPPGTQPPAVNNNKHSTRFDLDTRQKENGGLHAVAALVSVPTG